MSKINRRWLELDPSSPEHLRASDIPATSGTIQTELDSGLVKTVDSDAVKALLGNKIVAGSNVTIATQVDPTHGTQLVISSSGSSAPPETEPGATARDTTVYNPTARYQMVSTTGLGVSATSTSQLFVGLSWSRVASDLTITHEAHGRAIGDRVIIRNTNVVYQVALITAVTADTYTVTTEDDGAASGTSGVYGVGFTYAHLGAAGTMTGGVLYAPSNANVLLTSLRIHVGANNRASTTYQVTLPTNSYCGTADATGNDDIYMPLFMVRSDADSAAALAATISKNAGGSLTTHQLANLGAPTTGNLILLQF